MELKITLSNIVNFAFNKVIQVFGVVIIVFGLIFLLSLISYSPNDPNFIFPEKTEIQNILGFQGSYISDLFFAVDCNMILTKSVLRFSNRLTSPFHFDKSLT